MDWIDVSVPIREGMPTYPGDPPVHIELASSIADGANANVSRLEMSSHTGTHVDAPAHFIPGGPGVDALPLDALIGPAYVVDARSLRGPIDAAALHRLGIPDGETRLIFRTRNSDLWERSAFSADFIGLDAAAAATLVGRGVRLVGIDYLSIAPEGAPEPTHVELLAAGIVILEGLDLRSVPPGPYELVCLPLRVVGADGAPARAALRAR